MVSFNPNIKTAGVVRTDGTGRLNGGKVNNSPDSQMQTNISTTRHVYIVDIDGKKGALEEIENDGKDRIVIHNQDGTEVVIEGGPNC